ncbi:hypothetical protein C9374_006424 [Naegleria lovaniensis]|uniref:Cytochrome b5 heme-binding domain-containing protein n=1 Tax=Naegleria lovaniensis TaxID=51637 RepID=A0AA88GP12_NAELO|nr:uncharacterized protein C9374_006424 [Naegleria lovaniensis]KAG2381435.1 hypothetical protein C9374_006424 [Naegleria lovaniensis]
MIKLSMKQVQAQHGRKSKQPCFVISGRIIAIGKFKDEHPGGEDVMMEYAGLDATEAFESMRHSESAKRKVLELVIGEVVEMSDQVSSSDDDEKRLTNINTGTTSVQSPKTPRSSSGSRNNNSEQDHDESRKCSLQ